jgi:tetratricopeptide (TPR) repeat protein
LVGIAVAASVLVLALWGKSDLADRWSHAVAWLASGESTERSKLDLPVSEIARSSESDASKAAASRPLERTAGGSRPLERTAGDKADDSSALAPGPQKAFRDRTNLASVLNRPVTPETYTATAPYTRRSADGLPVHLPAVDPDLDLAAEVKAGLRQARQAEAAADYEGLQKALDRVLELDPLHPKALELRERAALYQLAEKALERAKELEQAGKVAEAYRVLDQVPEQMPLRPEAERRSSGLRKRALDDALERSGRALRAKRLEDAHRWATFVLSLEPDHAMALARVRSAERLMRKRKISYDAYRPQSAPVDASTTDGLEGAIRRQFPDRPGVARVLWAYARGDVESALRAARRVAPSERQAARRAAEQVRELKQRYDRVRTEVSNDPSRAWSLLLSLKKAEAELLPEGSKSYLVRELEVALSDAFSERGASRFREERYEEAYRKWQAGYRLDPTHPEIRSGLARLEQVARKMAQEAELRGQRGDDGACAQWRRITQMTRPESDIHRKARQRAARVCL